jgi:hypothetical protein
VKPGASLHALPADLRTFDASPQRWRWKHVESLRGRVGHHARFFCALEEVSDPQAISLHPGIPPAERGLRQAHLGQVIRVMLERLAARARNDFAQACFDQDSEELSLVRDAVATWSRIQACLVRHYYGLGERELDLAALEEAFLLFAGGELRVPVAGRRGIGEPDSAYYFGHAEFALMACDLGIDGELWRAQLPHLIWTQGVFVHMQRPVGAPPHRFHDYAPRGKERVFSLSVAADARETTRGKRGRDELEHVHTFNCRTAFGVPSQVPTRNALSDPALRAGSA